jgi:hypothetical protein
MDIRWTQIFRKHEMLAGAEPIDDGWHGCLLV